MNLGLNENAGYKNRKQYKYYKFWLVYQTTNDMQIHWLPTFFNRANINIGSSCSDCGKQNRRCCEVDNMLDRYTFVASTTALTKAYADTKQ